MVMAEVGTVTAGGGGLAAGLGGPSFSLFAGPAFAGTTGFTKWGHGHGGGGGFSGGHGSASFSHFSGHGFSGHSGFNNWDHGHGWGGSNHFYSGYRNYYRPFAFSFFGYPYSYGYNSYPSSYYGYPY